MEMLWDLCIVCQKDDKSKHLWEKPSSYKQMLTCIHTRGIYPEKSRQLADISITLMKDKGQNGIKSVTKTPPVMSILLEPKLGMRKRLSIELGQVLYQKSQSRVRLVTYLPAGLLSLLKMQYVSFAKRVRQRNRV